VSTSTSADIVICDAGIAGIAAAYSLAEALPDADILLVDRLPPMSLTSVKSGELYRNWWPDNTLARWIHHSIEMMEAHARASHNRFHMNRRGYAFVHTTAAGVEAARQSVERFASLGIGPARVHDGSREFAYQPPAPDGVKGQPDGVDLLLDPDLIRQHYPYVTPDATAIVHARRGGWFSAQQFGLYLLELAKARGVRELRAEVVDVQQGGRGVSAIRVNGPQGTQRVETRTVVNAAGPFFGRVAALLDIQLPVQAILHRLVVMPDSLGIIPRGAPFTILMDGQRLDWTAEEAARRDRLTASGFGWAGLTTPHPKTRNGSQPSPPNSRRSCCVVRRGWCRAWRVTWARLPARWLRTAATTSRRMKTCRWSGHPAWTAYSCWVRCQATV
jgi:glycine/D-amino acid oxidase-like deaminating enzyme